MKLLIDGRVLKSKAITGVQRYAFELVKSLRKMGVQYSISYPPSNNIFLKHIWEQTMLPLIAAGYDVLLCPGNIAPVWKIKGIKQAVVIHGLAYLHFPDTYKKSFVFYYTSMIPLIMKASDLIITVSDSDKKTIVENYPQFEKKILTIHPGISEEFFLVSPEPENYILYVGGFVDVKNIKGVLKAYIKLMHKLPHMLYICGGSLDVYKKLKDINSIMNEIPPGRIKILGHINDVKTMAELYRCASCLVFPSFYEGFGFPAVEAMACGCPAVVSDIPVFKEVCGDAAYYVDPYNVDSIANGIYEVIKNEALRKKLVESGVLMAKLYRWENNTKKLMEALNGII